MSAAAFQFIGRRTELKVLEQRYASSRSEMVPVYGRRRVGKTELLLRFASDKPTVYFTASDKLRTPQIADFLRAAAEWLAAPHLAEAAPATWDAALRLAIAAAPRQRKILLVLDEFQWLCQSSPELPSIIQRLWDLEWHRNNGLMLILCGSLIGFMEREVLGLARRSKAAGRRTCAWSPLASGRLRRSIQTGPSRSRRAPTSFAEEYRLTLGDSSRGAPLRRT